LLGESIFDVVGTVRGRLDVNVVRIEWNPLERETGAPGQCPDDRTLLEFQSQPSNDFEILVVETNHGWYSMVILCSL